MIQVSRGGGVKREGVVRRRLQAQRHWKLGDPRHHQYSCSRALPRLPLPRSPAHSPALLGTRQDVVEAADRLGEGEGEGVGEGEGGGEGEGEGER